MTAGVIVVVAVLLVGTAIGLWRRRTDGRFRVVETGRAGAHPVDAGRVDTGRVDTGRVDTGRVDTDLGDSGRVDPESDGGEPGDGVVGRRAEAGAGADEGESAAGQLIAPGMLASLGVEPARATLLQFSTAFCAPCRAVRRVSAEVAAMVPGVRHVDVDAESHLDVVRALDIWRTPTLLILDADGRVTRRSTGVPTKPQLLAALGAAIPESAPDQR